MQGIEERERTLQNTLVTAQRLTEELKESAKREAQLVLREAELQREKLLEAAGAEEMRLKNNVLALRRTRRQLFEGLRATVEMYQRLIAEELKELNEEPDAG